MEIYQRGKGIVYGMIEEPVGLDLGAVGQVKGEWMSGS